MIFSSSQSFGAYVDIDLLNCISSATAVRLGSINATLAVALDRNLSDHRFILLLKAQLGRLHHYRDRGVQLMMRWLILVHIMIMLVRCCGKNTMFSVQK